jgi:phosphoglycerate dehydrogenase-like enzyme
MPERQKVLMDPAFRKMNEIFEPEDIQRLHEMADVIWGRDEPMPDEEIARVKEDVWAVVAANWRYGSVDDWPKLHAILEVGGRHPSPNVLDYRACFARGIRVLSCAPAFGPQVAEAALGMALAASRDIVAGDRAFRQGEEKYLHAGNVGTFTLYGQTIGFIGYGGLARSLKPLLDPFHPQILAYDPWLPGSYLSAQGVTPVDLRTVLAESKVVFVLAIPSAGNRAMLDREHLELIQPGSVLVLISRSHLVDFDALTDLVMAGRFKAAIDVFPQEPLPKDHPIRQAPNTVLSAHRAGSVARDLRLIGHMVVDDLEAMLMGLPPMNMQVAQPEIVFRLE